MSKEIHTVQQYWDVRSELFGNYYKKPTLFDKIFRKGVYTRVAVATQVCKDFDTPSILDIGSGPGVNSITFLKNSSATKVTGIDFSSSMNQYARDLSKNECVEDRCDFIDGDFISHNFKGVDFDISVALGVLDYIEDANAFVGKMNDLTNKVFIISWPENGLRMLLRRYRYTCPLFHYTKNDIIKFHEQCEISDLKFIKSKGGWITVAYK
jgi:SAM-dependent methyltransferase